jgi:secreted trypsin-like serine protease
LSIEKAGTSRRNAIAAALILAVGIAFHASAFGQVERIIGGHFAAPGSWRYAVYVLYDGSYQCGGTLVAPSVVLTAAHCAENPETKVVHLASSYVLRIGSLDANSGGETHRVKRVVVHEDFGKSYPLENDIALLELDTPSNISPAPLDGLTSRSTSGRSAIERGANPFARIIGWGRTNADPSLASLSNVLVEASIPIVANTTCQSTLSKTLRPFGPIDDRRLCAGLGQGGIDTCNGDSGGPILAEDANGQWVQVGIVSYGDNICGREGTYGIYTRLSAFSRWLASHLSSQDTLPANTVPRPLPPSPLTSAETIIAAAQRADGQIRIEILSDDFRAQRRFRLGAHLKIRVTSAFAGSLLLFDIGEDGTINQLFPNQFSEIAYAHGHISPGVPVTLPDPTYGFALPTTLTAGQVQERNRLVAVVAENSATFDDITKSLARSNTLTRDSLARLEVVLRPHTAGGEAADPGRWAAAISDYIVDR